MEYPKIITNDKETISVRLNGFDDAQVKVAANLVKDCTFVRKGKVYDDGTAVYVYEKNK